MAKIILRDGDTYLTRLEKLPPVLGLEYYLLECYDSAHLLVSSGPLSVTKLTNEEWRQLTDREDGA